MTLLRELDASRIGLQDSKERFYFSVEEASGGPVPGSIRSLLWNSVDAVTDGLPHWLVSAFGWQ